MVVPEVIVLSAIASGLIAVRKLRPERHGPERHEVYRSTEAEVVDLYLRSDNMEVDEFEGLLDEAITGKRPSHPDLPLFAPLPLEELHE